VEGMLTEEQWARIAPLLPPQKPRGRKRADDHQTLEGILWARWQDLPKECCHRRLREWQEQEVWERLFRTFLSTLDEAGRLQWGRAFLDGTFVPAKRGEMRSGSPEGGREAR